MAAVAVSGTLGPYRQLVDGTLSVTIVIDPRFRADFHAMFDIGQGVALVPLAMGAAIEPVKAPEKFEPPAGFRETTPGVYVRETNRPDLTPAQVLENHEHVAKHGAKFPIGLCGLAVKWGNDAHFHGWLEDQFPDLWNFDQGLDDVERAREVVNYNCGVDSRKSLDTQPEAGELFRKNFLEPYSAARKADGVDG